MELDELKEMWAQYDRKLDVSVRLNQRLLSAAKVSKAGTAMRRFAVVAGMEAAATLVVIVALGSFIVEHAAMMRFALPAAALDVGAIAIFGSLIRQVMAAMQIDYDEPVAAVQRRVESVRILHIRYVRNVFLFATLAWVPLLIVTLQGLWGMDAYRMFSGAWLAANVMLGVAMIPLGLWGSKRFAERMSGHPMVQRIMNDLAGYNLNAAARALTGISEFEKEAIR